MKRDAEREGHADYLGRIRQSISSADAATPGVLMQAEYLSLLRRLIYDAAQPAPSATDIARYYRENPDDFTYPEVRFMRLVATESREQAVAAKQALEGGRPWASVIKEYSTDDDAVNPASGTRGTVPNELPPGLAKAVFAAPRGTYAGPAQGDRAWYVFEVTGIKPLPPKSLAEVRDQVDVSLRSRRELRAEVLLARRLRDRYRPITLCADDYELPECGNRSGSVRDTRLLMTP